MAAPPTGGHEQVYDEHERKFIDPFKTDDLNATSPAGRKLVVQSEILPPLFQYWAKVDRAVPDEEMADKRDVTIYQIHFGLL